MIMTALLVSLLNQDGRLQLLIAVDSLAKKPSEELSFNNRKNAQRPLLEKVFLITLCSTSLWIYLTVQHAC